MSSPTESEPVRPKLTVGNVLQDIKNGIIDLIINPNASRAIIPLMVCFCSIMTKVIIAKIPYTEIDFKTYMQQIEVINNGELLYEEIYGDTGPIVYPAGFVQIYQWIYWFIDNGTDITTAQQIFGYLLTITLVLVLITYSMCNDIPPWCFYLLLLSKRLISIYVLRLFNDCWTTICMVGVVVMLQQASYWYTTSEMVSFLLCLVASDLFSIAISIKMNALLYLPGFIIVSYFLVGENLVKFIAVLAIIPIIQIMMGWKFLLPFFNDEVASQIRWNYINQAFDFKRKFLYQWTVNWKFVSESTFLSDRFSQLLLALHISILITFVFTRFLNQRIIGKSLVQLIKDAFKLKNTIEKSNFFINPAIGPQLVMLIMSITNVIGVLCSRSLHYQFLSWYAWQLPFLFFSMRINVFVGILFWFIHEWCWNVFPATPISSGALVAILGTVVAVAWMKFLEIIPSEPEATDSKKNE